MNKMDYTEQNLSNLRKLGYKINSLSDKIEYYA